MVDREAVTEQPPPAAERDLDAEHKALILLLADHPDPKTRILAHISSRQFELSERMTAMQKSVDDGLAEVKRSIAEGFRDLRDRVAALDDGFEDVEERTTSLENSYKANGSSLHEQ